MNLIQRICIGIILYLPAGTLFGQHLEMIAGGRPVSLRGLCPVSEKIIWASGSKGQVALSTDGGTHWNWHAVDGFEDREFRDIEAFDARTAVIIAVGEPAQILKTTDGGAHWHIRFTDSAQGSFLDAMDFADNKNGIIVGDPLKGSQQLYLLVTHDQGEHWSKIDPAGLGLPDLNPGEAMFAASGSNIRFTGSGTELSKSRIYIITGGTRSRLLTSKPASGSVLPLQQGLETTGANGMGFRSARQFVIVGGDFAHDRDTAGNCVFTKDAGQSWIRPVEPPHGYRSAVAWYKGKKWIACGTTGVDISSDNGLHWSLISVEGFHVCRKSKKGHSIFLAGTGGRIARLSW